MNATCSSDLLVFSHLRWDFVFQRPQQLMSRFAHQRRVYYFEGPVFSLSSGPKLQIKESLEKVKVIVPHLPASIVGKDVGTILRGLVDELMETEGISDFTSWYYNPQALHYTRHLQPSLTVFDCIDVLSLYKEGSQALGEYEKELMKKADLVFTSGHALYEARKDHHHNIHALPNSIDREHFAKARNNLIEPLDQRGIPHPRIGYYGIIDPRLNLKLLEKLAEQRPEFQFILIGPVSDLDPVTLPRRANIHYLGKKAHHELPGYISGWDCAIMPFTLNEETRYISPTKTMELLAAAKPIISTSLEDVVHPFADAKLVSIANHAAHFIDSMETAMSERSSDTEWVKRVDAFLDGHSWDATVRRMSYLENQARLLKSEELYPNFRQPVECSIETQGLVHGAL